MRGISIGVRSTCYSRWGLGSAARLSGWRNGDRIVSTESFGSNNSVKTNNDEPSKKKLSRAQMRDQAVERFRGKTNSLANRESWEELWNDGLTAWEIGMPSAALTSEVSSHLLFPTKSAPNEFRALVPGCGTGHDLVALAQHLDRLMDQGDIERATVVGLDFAIEPIQQGKEVLTRHLDQHPHQRTQVDLVLGDFFDSTTWQTEATFGGINAADELPATPSTRHRHRFHFIFDCCFFCALPPTLRDAWGRRTAELLDEDRGQLLTLIFPILKTVDRNLGPPFPVTLGDYEDVLRPHGLDIAAGPHANPDTIRSRKGMELACWWRKRS